MNVLNVAEPAFMLEEEVTLFSDSVGRWLDDNCPPEKVAQWKEDGIVPRDLWTRAGEAGLSCVSTPEEWGGMG